MHIVRVTEWHTRYALRGRSQEVREVRRKEGWAAERRKAHSEKRPARDRKGWERRRGRGGAEEERGKERDGVIRDN